MWAFWWLNEAAQVELEPTLLAAFLLPSLIVRKQPQFYFIKVSRQI
jgi:hypothetical protein